MCLVTVWILHFFLPAVEHAGLQVAPKKVVIWEKWVPTFSQMGKVGSYIFSNGKGGFTINMENEMENNNDNANLSPRSAAGL